MKTQAEMMILVPQKIKEIEQTYGVEILWAVESGSRAWGFESPDSDFDIRFIYKRKPQDYLQLTQSRDVIELPIDDTWDINGWDLDKALRLLAKSNPTLFEWLQSPIIYFSSKFQEDMTPLLERHFSEKRMMHHYLSTAKLHLSKYLSDDTVRPKKYFYALRPVLACQWIQKHHTIPPVPFNNLVTDCLPAELHDSVNQLLDIKKAHSEAAQIPPIPDIHTFLEQSIQEIETYLQNLETSQKPDWQALNRFFLDEIGVGDDVPFEYFSKIEFNIKAPGNEPIAKFTCDLSTSELTYQEAGNTGAIVFEHQLTLTKWEKSGLLPHIRLSDFEVYLKDSPTIQPQEHLKFPIIFKGYGNSGQVLLKREIKKISLLGDQEPIEILYNYISETFFSEFKKKRCYMAHPLNFLHPFK